MTYGFFKFSARFFPVKLETLQTSQFAFVSQTLFVFLGDSTAESRGAAPTLTLWASGLTPVNKIEVKCHRHHKGNRISSEILSNVNLECFFCCLLASHLWPEICLGHLPRSRLQNWFGGCLPSGSPTANTQCTPWGCLRNSDAYPWKAGAAMSQVHHTRLESVHPGVWITCWKLHNQYAAKVIWTGVFWCWFLASIPPGFSAWLC